MSLEYTNGYLKGIQDSAWTCVDCGNTYDSLVEECPNKLLDEAYAHLRREEYRAKNE